jgi:hypothetical protein
MKIYTTSLIDNIKTAMLQFTTYYISYYRMKPLILYVRFYEVHQLNRNGYVNGYHYIAGFYGIFKMYNRGFNVDHCEQFRQLFVGL